MKRLFPLATVGVLLVSLAPAPLSHAARGHGGLQPAAPATMTVLIGLGRPAISHGSALIFTPKYVDITVGDTVVWRDVDALEPHTVSFGPMAMLKQIANTPFLPMPQKSGPPLLVVNPKFLLPTPGHAYDGTGFASSGFLRQGQSWSLTFTMPGTYHYICLVHGLTMSGVVIVHPQQPQGKLHIVQAGDGLAALSDPSNQTTNDAFYPQHLRIHVGDTVEWIGGFHTVTFGPTALINQLEKSLFIPMPQKSGPPQFVVNPKAAFPSGGPTYDGTGFVNSGLLILRVPPGSKAPPTYRLTFTKPGVYEYDCLIHAGMEGTITVAPAGGS